MKRPLTVNELAAAGQKCINYGFSTRVIDDTILLKKGPRPIGRVSLETIMDPHILRIENHHIKPLQNGKITNSLGICDRLATDSHAPQLPKRNPLPNI